MNITSITTTTPVPLRNDFHVVPEGVYWKITREHRAYAVGMYLTKAEAVGEGMRQAREGYVSLVIHGRDGRIKSVWSYDNFRGPHE